jgi:hypothetical protein
MWSKADDLRLSVLVGLRRGLKLCRGMRWALTEDEQNKVAAVIVEDLERSNWKIEQGPMPEGHSRVDGEVNAPLGRNWKSTMSDSDAIPFGAAIAGDVLSAFQLPGGNTLVKVADAYIAKKRREAANILIEEISNGYHGSISFEAHDVDPLIEITLRFSKAVADGAARANLTFLAQVIAGSKKTGHLMRISFASGAEF